MSRNIEWASLSATDLIQDLLQVHGDPLAVQMLCRAGVLLGLSESAVRVGLNRLVGQGRITHTARGYYAYKTTGSALSRTVDDWQHREDTTVAWSGKWLGVQDAAVLRSDKTGWRHHCLALTLLGFRQFQPGLQIRPDNLAGGTATVRAQLQALGLAAQAQVFCLDQLDSAGQTRALGLWNLEHTATLYQQLQDALAASARQFGGAELDSMVRESLLLGRTVIGHLLRDPLLPQEMEPSRARASLLRDMLAYQKQARQHWRIWLALSVAPSARAHIPTVTMQV